MIDKQLIEQNPVISQLILSELTVLQSSSHPNIMNVFEMVEDKDRFYIAAELLEGGELT